MIRGIYDEQKLALVLSGHADYAPKGKDIVCAGVSALAFAYANHIGGYKKDQRGMVLRAKGTNETEKAAFKAILNGLQLIAREYPENLLLTRGRL